VPGVLRTCFSKHSTILFKENVFHGIREKKMGKLGNKKNLLLNRKKLNL
jgi:hypothetical protein